MYQKINFKDFIDSRPDIYLVNGKETTIKKDNTGLKQQGTLLSAENLNHLEDGIYNNSVDIKNANNVVKQNSTNIGDTKQLKIGSNLVEAINKVFTSASNNKEKIKNAITGIDNNITLPQKPSFEDLENAIKKINNDNIQVGKVIKDKETKLMIYSNLKFKPNIIIFFTKNDFVENSVNIALVYYNLTPDWMKDLDNNHFEGCYAIAAVSTTIEIGKTYTDNKYYMQLYDMGYENREAKKTSLGNMGFIAVQVNYFEGINKEV